MEYAHLFTIMALVFVLFWQSRVIHKAERERDRIRRVYASKLFISQQRMAVAQSEIRALEARLLEVEK